jgi:hypothetical protein
MTLPNEDEMPETFQIDLRLTVRESKVLLLMAGYATGCAQRNRESFATEFILLTNKINEQNPNWTPIPVPN